MENNVFEIDQFFNLLTDWQTHLSTSLDVFGDPSITMMVVGLIEILKTAVHSVPLAHVKMFTHCKKCFTKKFK